MQLASTEYDIKTLSLYYKWKNDKSLEKLSGFREFLVILRLLFAVKMLSL